MLSIGCDAPTTAPYAEPSKPDAQVAPIQPASARSTLALDRDRILSPAIVALLGQHHLQKKPLDDTISKDAFARYISQLDPGRLFLLQPQVDQLRKAHATTLDEQMQSGRLKLAEEGPALLRQQTAVVKAIIDELLSVPMQLDGTTPFETEASKRGWSKTPSALRTQWRNVLLYQVLQRMLAMENPDVQPSATERAAHERRARDILREQYNARLGQQESQSELDNMRLVFNAIASVYDPHTAYLAPAGRAKFDSEVRGSTETFTRGALLKASKRSKQTGYIRLSRFYGDTRATSGDRRSNNDVASLLTLLHPQKIDALILDLRGNGGGFLDDARQIAGFFIDKGPIVQTRQADGTLTLLSDDTSGTLFEGQLVVLVDSGTRSAAEILAAALQDYQRALIVGVPTHGKGTVQILVDLDAFIDSTEIDDLRPLGSIRLTSQHFFRISGASTQNRGVLPDIALPAQEHLKGERALPHALPWTSIKPASFKPWSKSNWDPTLLRAKSKARQRPGTALHTHARTAQQLQRFNAETTLELNLKTMRAQRQERLNALKALQGSAKPRLRVEGLAYTPKYGTKTELDAAWLAKIGEDPWLEEALMLLADMKAFKKKR